MTEKPVNTLRRRILIGSMAAVAGAPLMKNMLVSPAHAGDLPQVDENSAIAKH